MAAPLPGLARRLRARVGVLAACAAAPAVPGCTEPPPFEPIRLVVEAHARAPVPFVAPGATVTIDGVARTSLDAVTPIAPPVETVGQAGVGKRKSRATIPAELRAVPWLVLESVVTHDGVTTMMRSWPVSGALAGGTYDALIVDARVPPGGRTGVLVWPVPDLAMRDVTTRGVVVPARAVLRVAAGLEAASWPSTVTPLDMTITAIADGAETPLRAVRVDPRRPGGRAWIDLAVPLDALAGRTARFRFASRPIVGPTAVPALPVWSAPEIVDARTPGG